MPREATPSRRSSWAVVVASVAVLGFFLATISVSPAKPGFHFERFAGADRYDTARLIAAGSFDSSDSVVLATGERFPDALAANYVAGVADVPILLTAGGTLPAATAQALSDLKTTKVLVAGGPS